MSAQLRRDTLQYTAALLASRAVAVVFVIVLPAFLSPRDYGVLAVLSLATALCAPVLTLELGQGLGRYYPTAAEVDQRHLLRTSFTFTCGSVGAAGLLALLFARPLTVALLGDLTYLDAFRAGILFCLGNIIYLYLQNLLRWQFRSTEYLILNLLGAVLMLGFGVLCAARFASPLLGVLVGQALGVGVTLLWAAVRMRADLRFGWSRPALRRMLSFSFPLVFASLTLFASTYASRVALQTLTTLDAVGRFTWASQIAGLPALLLLGVQAALTPYVMRHHAEPECPPLLARSFELTVALILTGCLALGLLAPTLVRVAGYDAYAHAATLVLPLAPAALMLNLYVFAPGFAVAERSDLQLWVSLLGALVAVAANYGLIALFGEQGAVLAMLLASGSFFALWFVASQRLYPIPFRVGRLLLFLLVYAGCGWFGTSIEVPRLGIAPVLVPVLLVGLCAATALALRLVDLRQVLEFAGLGRRKGTA